MRSTAPSDGHDVFHAKRNYGLDAGERERHDADERTVTKTNERLGIEALEELVHFLGVNLGEPFNADWRDG